MTVPSESAHATSAAEARFRIATPKPTSRTVQVIALDAAGPDEVAAFIDAVPSADLVVMVVPAGGDAGAAAPIGRACSDRRVMTTAIVVRNADATDQDVSHTLAQVRPWSLMVVVVGDDASVAEILASFR